MLSEKCLLIKNRWKVILNKEISKNYFKKLDVFVSKEYKDKDCFPQESNIFKIFNLLEPNNIKVIILGQDPYFTEGFADGIAFSTKNTKIMPKSLQNIFKEISKNYLLNKPNFSDLSYLVKQGVFLINTILTVEKNKPLSHANQGWEKFVINSLQKALDLNNNICIMLWGKNAQKYERFFMNYKNVLILKTSHPSPLSYNQGFKNCNHFKICNDYLRDNKLNIINWGDN